MKTLYIFLDESGNFDFTRGGTNHFLISAVTALHPMNSSQALQKLKYELLELGHDVDCFHASPDSQVVRDFVFTVINSLDNIKINYLYADKHKAHPSLHSPEKIYSLFGKTLLKYIFKSWTASQYDEIIIIFDKALTNKQQKAFLGVVKPELKATGKRYRIYFHKTMADFNAQIADYSAWAKYVSLERGEMRPLASIERIPIESLDIFRTGTTKYY